MKFLTFQNLGLGFVALMFGLFALSMFTAPAKTGMKATPALAAPIPDPVAEAHAAVLYRKTMEYRKLDSEMKILLAREIQVRDKLHSLESTAKSLDNILCKDHGLKYERPNESEYEFLTGSGRLVESENCDSF